MGSLDPRKMGRHSPNFGIKVEERENPSVNEWHLLKWDSYEQEF
jgi:hypothetical protein